MHCKIRLSKMNESVFLASYNDDHGKYYYATSLVWCYWKIRFIVKYGNRLRNVSLKTNGGLNVDYISGIEQVFAIWDKLWNSYLVWTQFLFFSMQYSVLVTELEHLNT